MINDLKKLQWHIWLRWRETLQKTSSMDLTNSELDYLYALMEQPEGMRLTELAEQVQVSKASASAMMKKLVARGYVRRFTCQQDGRALLLNLTGKGRAIEKEEMDIYADTVQVMMAALSATEQLQLQQLLAKACRHLTI